MMNPNIIQNERTANLVIGYGLGAIVATIVLYKNTNKKNIHIMIGGASAVILLFGLYLKNK